ncbi:hypothetical protein Mag101_11295 [Microbulbifer agarilyticus]|uniref:Rubredoxin-like domain-containing protein n=1 Tax=Microbulbifer agarilyticus TaxID=260552 RepID=A0A1Q2M5Y3_9GAMM|nr:FAD-dependent oxidoreductase [Microbulbifer agarilyticus]AQQ68155.1 hypothetical protein Mag101_11295 [Microbulbifer agarilyticus]
MTDYKTWECLVCGWVYDEANGWPEDGIAPGTRWEDIPNDWLCPDCGVGKADFEMVEVAVPTAESQPNTSEAEAKAEKAQEEPYKLWECLVCGWFYDEAKGWPEDGIAPGTRWEDISDDWLCPECGVGKQDFEMQVVGTSTASPANDESPVTADSATGAAPIVIIGSGLAGYTLVKELRKLDQQTPVVILTADDGRFYSKPLLSTGFHKQKTADDLATATAVEMANEYQIEVRTMSEVTAIDTAGQCVELDSQKLPYSKLVLANGAACIDAPLTGNGLEHVHSVNDLTDYARFHTAMKGVQKVLIIGAGLIGSEYANDLVQSGYKVDVVDPMPNVLSSLLPATAANSVQAALEEAGVTFHFKTVVNTVKRSKGSHAVVAQLDNGDAIEADIVLSAIGVRPRTDLAAAAGLQTNRGILVDRNLKTSADNVYALGDCAEVDGHVLFYVAPLMASARALARTLTGETTAVKYGTLPITIKTTLYPVVTNPPPRDCEGEWTIEQTTVHGVRAVFRDTDGKVGGFALTGQCVTEREALVQETPPVMA